MRLIKTLIACLSSLLIACGGSVSGSASSFSFLSIFAGNPYGGTAGYDGTGSEARLSGAYGIATDAGGNVYVADRSNHTIRKITPAGVVTTVAGTAGTSGSADGTEAAARFNSPSAVATDASGNVYVADTSNSTIRKITPAGVVTTLAGTAGTSGSADGIGAAARFNSPLGVATDASGIVYVADSNRIRKITPAGVVTTLAGTAGSNGFQPGALPAGLSSTLGIAVYGSKIYFSNNNGIGVIN